MAAAEEIWITEKFTTMIESLHTGMMVNVKNGGEVWNTFAIANGVNQRRLLALTLSYIYNQQCSKRILETWGTLQSEDKTTNIFVR